jgi:hypothetical protein
VRIAEHRFQLKVPVFTLDTFKILFDLDGGGALFLLGLEEFEKYAAILRLFTYPLPTLDYFLYPAEIFGDRSRSRLVAPEIGPAYLPLKLLNLPTLARDVKDSLLAFEDHP